MAQVIAGGILVAWVVEAVLLGRGMGRRGYDAYAWTVMALAIGPIAVGLAVWTRGGSDGHPRLVRAGHAGRGGVDILVGIDGSPESTTAARRAVQLLGSRAGRVTLAGVIPLDASPIAEARAQQQLAAASAAAGTRAAGQVVLRGRPVDALRDYAGRLGYELLAVGTRGEGRAHTLVGSVASGLVKGGGVPVLLVDAEDSADRSHGVERVAS